MSSANPADSAAEELKLSASTITGSEATVEVRLPLADCAVTTSTVALRTAAVSVAPPLCARILGDCAAAELRMPKIRATAPSPSASPRGIVMNLSSRRRSTSGKTSITNTPPTGMPSDVATAAANRSHTSALKAAMRLDPRRGTFRLNATLTNGDVTVESEGDGVDEMTLDKREVVAVLVAVLLAVPLDVLLAVLVTEAADDFDTVAELVAVLLEVPLADPVAVAELAAPPEPGVERPASAVTSAAVRARL